MSGKKKHPQQKRPLAVSVSLVVIALLVLVAVYVFQQFSLFHFLSGLVNADVSGVHPYIVFIVNKTCRLLINDAACMLLIVALFPEKKYLTLAFYVFLFEVLILLPLYFVIKLNLEGDSEISSPLLSQVHRMIVNPTLMILLMVSFFYQRLKARKP